MTAALHVLATVWTAGSLSVIGWCTAVAVQDRRAQRQQERHAAALVAEIEQHNADAADVLAEAESIVRTLASALDAR